MVKEYELREELETAAKLISRYESNPITWLRWITYFLKELEDQALDMNPMNQDRYEDMLSLLQDVIHQRRRTGGWSE